MVLESTIICCDNSNYQLNGDYVPTRLIAQTEAINLICLSKMRSHPENNVALMTIANTVEVLSTLTSDIGRIAMKVGKVTPKGDDINLVTGLRIAHLVLKHRQGKNHRMRIVAFVGSPLKDFITDELVGLAKRLKKEKVQVDIVSYGGHLGNEDILRKFIETINGKDGVGSHMVDVPRGSEIMAALIHSPIVVGEDGNDATGLTTAYEYGVDPNEDPDLALALRISMEEERQRQEAERLRAEASEASTSNVVTPRDNVANENITNMTEEQQIAYALEMSLQQDVSAGQEKSKDSKTPDTLTNIECEDVSVDNFTNCCSSSSARKGKDKDKKKKK